MSLEDFLRRLIKPEPRGDRERDAEAWDNSEPDEDDDDDGSGPAERVYLEFVGGSSAKFYALAIVQGEDGTWGVAFNFGRIGSPREWGRKAEGVSREKAQAVFDSFQDEKLRGGYEERLWPADLEPPVGAAGSSLGAGDRDEPAAGIYTSTVAGVLPPAEGGLIAGVSLPPGRLLTLDELAGPVDDQPVLWISERPIDQLGWTWAQLAAAFADTGLWPVIIDEEGEASMDDRLLGYPPISSRDATSILRHAWGQNVPSDDEFDPETYAPLRKRFPGLAPATPGDRPTTIQHLVADATGYLGLVAVERPADVPRAISWSGPANYDLHPADQSSVLRSWEARFDAYLVGLGSDTMILAVARPALDRPSATRIAAEHMAFCPDNVWQGVGTVREYADLLVGAKQWWFWWD